VKRDNVICAVTHHGGHLGYFEGGIMLPNSVTWLDRIVVDYSTALLRCRSPAILQQQQIHMSSNLYASCKPSIKKSSPTNDDTDDGDMLQQQRQAVDRSTSPTLAASRTDAENKLATENVAEILKVSANVAFTDTESDATISELPAGIGAMMLANNDDIVVMKSVNIGHSMM